MTTLNQIIAIEKDVKSKSYSKFTEAHQRLQKSQLLNGISRTYQPKDDEGDPLPSESTQVQFRVADMLNEASAALIRLFDIVATKDITNCEAKANIVVGDKTILENVPVTYLLFLEKQLTDLHTFFSQLPVLDQAEEWKFDKTKNAWATNPVQTVKTSKRAQNHVRFPGDQHHPPQVDIINIDVIVGTWTTIKYSGAESASRIEELVKRVTALKQAVVFAREQANMQTAVDGVNYGKRVFDYLLGT